MSVFLLIKTVWNDSTIVNVSKVVGVNASAVSTMFLHVNEVLTSLSLLLSSAYTVYKIISDKPKKQNNDPQC